MTMTAANQTATAVDKRVTMTVVTVDKTPPMTTTDQTVTANQTATATMTAVDKRATMTVATVDQTPPMMTMDQIATAMLTSSDNPASLPNQCDNIYSNTTIAEATTGNVGIPNVSLIKDSRDGVQTASLRVLSNPMLPLVPPIQTFENLTTNFAASLRTVQTTMVSANPPTSVGLSNVGTGKKKTGIMRPNLLSTTAR